MKSKFVFGLLAIMMILVLAPSSFAQVNITINNVAAAQEVQTNRAAETSDTTSLGAGITVSGALLAQSDLTSTSLILTFPSNITTDAIGCEYAGQPCSGGSNIPDGDPLRIEGATGVFSGATILTRVGGSLTIALVDPVSGRIIANSQSGSFRILGLRINGNGLTAPVSGTASLSSSANNFFLNTSSFPAITAFGAGIASITSSDQVQIFTNRTITDTTANLIINEGFASAWRTDAQNEIDVQAIAGVVASGVRVTVSGIPTGVTITWGIDGTNSTIGATTSGGATTGTIDSSSSTSNQINLIFTSGSSLTSVEALEIDFTVGGSLSTTPTAGNITATVTMAPTGSTSNSNSLASSQVPTFTVAEVGPATIGSIVAANTTLLVTYALRSGAFDTGIQVANTTADPFGVATGGATPTAGNLIFDFFPRNTTGTAAGTPFQLVTSSSVVFGGLDASGNLLPGNSFVALLSEILSRTSFTGDFSGYIFIRTNFLNAHGTATISDFRTYSLAANVLVLPPPASFSRNTPSGGAEQLSY
jgi:hypothetical protein